jgi:hypothetical protein
MMRKEIFLYAVEVGGRPLSGFPLPFGLRKTVYLGLVTY